MSTKDVSNAEKEIPVEQLNADFKRIIRKVLNYNSLRKHFARDDTDALSECWVAYLENHKIEDVWNHLREWQYDHYVSRSDRSLSVNWLPTAPRTDVEPAGIIVRTKDGHIQNYLDNGIDKPWWQVYENDPQYEIEYQFADGWPGTGGPDTGGIYLYPRPYPDNADISSNRACAYRVGNSSCELLYQDMRLIPEYYMVGDICWECYLANGIDPIRFSVNWLWLVDATFTAGMLTRKEAMTFYLDMADYYSRFHRQIAHRLGVQRQSVDERLDRAEKKLKKSLKNPASALYIYRERAKRLATHIENCEKKHRWHQPPKHRMPTEILLQAVINGEKIHLQKNKDDEYCKDPLELMEQQCKPAGWQSSRSFLCPESDVECFEWNGTNVVSGEGDSCFSKTGETGLNWGIGSYITKVETCPECLSLIKAKTPPGKCPKCEAKLQRCKNVNCKRKDARTLLSVNDKKCFRCGTSQDIKVLPESSAYCPILAAILNCEKMHNVAVAVDARHRRLYHSLPKS